MNYSPRPLLPEEQKEFGENLPSLVGEIDRANRKTDRVLIAIAALGAVFGLSGVFAYTSLIPYIQYRTISHYIEVDHATGSLSFIPGPADAPKTFGPRTRESEAQKYIELYVEYEPGSDQKHYEKVQALSSEDQAASYVSWHNSDPEAPRQATQGHGSVETRHFIFTYNGTSMVKGIETHEYTVLFSRRQINGGAVGKWEDWRGLIQFHFDPKLVQNEDQIHDNPSGLVVTSFTQDKVR